MGYFKDRLFAATVRVFASGKRHPEHQRYRQHPQKFIVYHCFFSLLWQQSFVIRLFL
jgi:hypothetical protein